MKKLVVKLVVSLVLLVGILASGICLADSNSFTTPVWSYGFSNPGFVTIINTPAVQSYQVRSWSFTPNQASTGFVSNGNSSASYTAKGGISYGTATVTTNGYSSSSSASVRVTSFSNK